MPDENIIGQQVHQEVINNLERETAHILHSRGYKDHFSYIARVLNGELTAEQLPYHMYDASIKRFNTDGISIFFDDSIHSPAEILYPAGYSYDEVIYETRYLDPVLDKQALGFLRRHRDQIARVFPNLAYLIDRLSPVTESKLKACFEEKRPFNLDDITFAESISQTATAGQEKDQMVEIFSIVGSSAFARARALLGKELSSPADFDKLWPEEQRTRVEYLSRVNRIFLLSFLTDLTRQHTYSDNNAVAFALRKEVYDENVEGEIESFIFENFNTDFFNPHFLSQISGVDVNRITPAVIQSIRASLVTKERLPELLSRLDYPAVAVLDKYRGKEFCQKTEGRLLHEVEDGTALVVCYEFPDGKKVYIAVKFTELTLGVTLNKYAKGSGFREECIYFPIGKTFKTLQELHREGEKFVRYKIDPQDPVTHMWAFTRGAGEPRDGVWDQIVTHCEERDRECRVSK